MELVKFSNMLGGSDPASPPFRIPARDLDRNFAMLKPLRTDGNARQYLLTETPEGWSIKIFPDFPSGEGPFFLAFANGRLYWTGSNVDEPEDALNPIGDAPADGNTYGRKDLAWSALNLVPNPPASGTYVLGSTNGVISWLATEAC